MQTLNQKYIIQLESIKTSIQNSDILQRYLEDEEDEVYNELRNAFEPEIQALHEKIVHENPLQIIAFEKLLFDDEYEGLYLPRILGYSVLRGEVSKDRIKYLRPQSHFRDVLLTVCNSINFDVLKLRIGQALQMGFALSSDIWITNIIKSIDNKKVKQFLDSQKLEKYRDSRIRWTGLVKFRKQFESLSYQSADFPTSPSELKQLAPALSGFLLFRASSGLDNSSLNGPIKEFIDNKDFRKSPEYIELMIIIGMCYPTKDDLRISYMNALADLRDNYPEFDEQYFQTLKDLLDSRIDFKGSNFKGFSDMIDRKKDDQLSQYYNMMDVVNSKGYVHNDAIEAVASFYEQHEGRSIENECTRQIIFGHCAELMNNLPLESYSDYFEINKVFVSYMNVFSNQKFNQNVKDLSLKYIKRLIKKYTDKRGRDYQEIKKFVKTTFLELGFMKEKELIELFKTKRKKKVA